MDPSCDDIADGIVQLVEDPKSGIESLKEDLDSAKERADAQKRDNQTYGDVSPGEGKCLRKTNEEARSRKEARGNPAQLWIR